MCHKDQLQEHTFSVFLLLLTCVVRSGNAGDSGPISDSLRAGRSKDRIPVRSNFSVSVQAGPGAHPASDTIKWPGRGVDHHPPSSDEVKETVELYLSPSAP